MAKMGTYGTQLRGTVLYALFAALAFMLPAEAFAQTDASAVAGNITDSIAFIPGLITGAAYLLAILLGVTGVIKLKEHVENPSQTKVNAGLTRLFTGGALLALPIILDAMMTTLTGGEQSGFGGFIDASTGMMSSITGGTGTSGGINEMLGNIVYSVELVPGLLTGVAYLLGLFLGYTAILKIKEHVENPEQVKISEGIVRLIIGGALFSLPTIYEAMYMSLTGGDTAGGGFVVSLISGAGGILYSNQAQMDCAANGTTFGGAVCQIITFASAAPSFLNAMSYLFGLVLGLWSLLKIRDHVLDPRSTPIWDGASKLIAGGAFFALPYMLDVAAGMVSAEGSSFLASGAANSGFNETAGGGAGGCAPAGLDMAMYCLMADIFAPLHAVLNFFTLVAGILFVMIGISRLMKSAQDGAKGPGGVGTLMTFLTGGILISFNSILGAVSQSMFASNMVLTNATLSYKDGLGGEEIAHVHTVISAIVKFMIIVGLISFVRGWFIMRDVAEGNSQASVMAGTTHIIGGALAVNLGPLLNAVQETLGITGLGIAFG